MSAKRIILASTSPFRRELLGRLGLPFECVSPDYPENDPTGLAPAELARLHALQKAREVAKKFPLALVIGSDQVAELDGKPLGKPETHERAFAQLKQMSGREVLFHTGLAVVSGGREEVCVERFSVVFKALADSEIENYLRRDEPYGCAGSFKIEGLGIALMDRMEGEDYTSLIGLPLIRLTKMLAAFGVKAL